MNLEESLEIFNYLARSGREGKSILTISRELKLKPKDVRNCITSLKGSFVRVGNSENFTVNNFKTASQESLIKEHQSVVKTDKNDNFIFWALIAISLFSSVTAILANRA